MNTETQEIAVINIQKECFDKAKTDTFENCKILYRGRRKSYTESLMCFGWECSATWNKILQKLSYKLEDLNIRYFPKFRTRIEASQVKEKFGTLRFYYDVITEPPFLVDCWRRVAKYFANKLDCNKFGYKSVVDSPKYKSHNVSEISKSEYDRVMKNGYIMYDMNYHTENGKFYKIVHLNYAAITHMEPTRHKVRYMLMLFFKKLSVILDFRHRWKPSPEQKIAAYVMSNAADAFINEAEDETEHVCYECGATIGTDYSPACVTSGWITYLCSHCAEKQMSMYNMNGKTYQNGKEIQTSSGSGFDM